MKRSTLAGARSTRSTKLVAALAFVPISIGALASCAAVLGLDDYGDRDADGGPSGSVPRDADVAPAEASAVANADAGPGASADAAGDADRSVVAAEAGSDAAEAGPDADVQMCNGVPSTNPGTSTDVMHCGPCNVVCIAPQNGTYSGTAMCVDGICGYTAVDAAFDGWGTLSSPYADSAGLRGSALLTRDSSSVVVVAVGSTETSTGIEAWLLSSATGTTMTDAPVGDVSVATGGAASFPVLLGGDTALDVRDSNGDIPSTYNCAQPFLAGSSWAVDVNDNLAWKLSATGLVQLLFKPGTCRGEKASLPDAGSDAGTYAASAADPQLYISGDDTGYSFVGGTIVGWDLKNAAIKWTASVPRGSSAGSGAIAADGSFVFVLQGTTSTSPDGSVGHIDKGGNLLWDVSFSGPGGAPVITADGAMIFYSANGFTTSVVSFDIATGTERWSSAATVGVPTGQFAVTNDGMVWDLEYIYQGARLPTGQIVARHSTSGNIVKSIDGFEKPADFLFADNAVRILSYFVATLTSVPMNVTYDPQSPWPTSGHDTLRTFNASAPTSPP